MEAATPRLDNPVGVSARYSARRLNGGIERMLPMCARICVREPSVAPAQRESEGYR
jgi:hypothetical protein